MTQSATACGKIILCGEYAVVFGYPGIAVPSPQILTVTFDEGDDTVQWDAPPGWKEYAMEILHRTGAHGTLTVASEIPLGKGMGASTALVIAICRAVLGPDCRTQALAIEDAVNPGHSGIDFAVIWEKHPLLYKKGSAWQSVQLPEGLLAKTELIDTGTPNETTAELVAWMQSRKEEPDISNALEMIGGCAERLLGGEQLLTIIRDHNQAQQTLGVVPDKAKILITKVEQEGGAAKVIGAGARTGGGGMVLAFRAA